VTAFTNRAALPAAQIFSYFASWTNTRRACLVPARIFTEATAFAIHNTAALLQLLRQLHDMSAHRRSIDRDSAEGSRSEAAVCSEIICYSCDSTEHLANDLACPNMAPRSRATMQQRAETLDDAQIRELLELRAERAHLRKISGHAKTEEQCDGRGKDHGVATSAAKVNRCSGDKLATTYACIAASSLTPHPSLTHSVSGTLELRAERTHPRNISNCAQAEEECDGEIKEYEVARYPI